MEILRTPDERFDGLPPHYLGKRVHVIFGDADPVFPYAWGEVWSRSISGATPDRIAGAGHSLQQDAPDDLADTMLRRLGAA